MDFEITEEQKLLKRSASEFFAKECPPGMVRGMASDAEGFPRPLWQKMAELGWLGCIVPEQYGGLGGNFIDLVVLLEEIGRASLPAPYFAHLVTCLIVLQAADEPQKSELLPSLSDGSLLMVPALIEDGLSYDLAHVTTRAIRLGDEYAIRGKKTLVPALQAAERMVLTAVVEGRYGVTLLDVPVDSQGIHTQLLPTRSGEKLFGVTLDDVKTRQTDVIGEEGEAASYLEPVMQKAAVAKCAEMLGAAHAILEMTVQYAKERVQFGQPIGSFQAVQHHCANMLVDLDTSRLVTFQAAFSISEGLPLGRQASAAKAWVSEAYRRIDALGHQVHGGVGLMDEHDLTLYTKRSMAAQASYGDADFHRELVARNLGL